MQKNRVLKLSETRVLEIIQKAIKKEKIVISLHAERRMSERNITWFEIKQALLFGHNERRKDKYVENFGTWIYSMRYDLKISDVEKKRLRIPIAIDNDGVVIVSAIDLDQFDQIR